MDQVSTSEKAANQDDSPPKEVDESSEQERKKTKEAQTKLEAFLLGYTSSHEPTEKDLLNSRYRINLAKPLEEYDGQYAKAFEAEDTQEGDSPCIAIVCDPEKVQRYRAIEIIRGFDHRAILPLLAAGAVELSRGDVERFVIIYRRPQGQRLSELIATSKLNKSPHYVLERIFIPLLTALEQFYEVETSHGCLNADNIYFDGNVAVMGPCASGPCGHSQTFYFEAPERMQAHPCAKGEGTITHDYYALAVLLLYIYHGADHFKPFTPEKLVHLVLREGAYHVLLRDKEVPEIFYDFLRGSLTQTPEDRWGIKQMKVWLGGKRFNVLPPPPPSEAVRPYEFKGVHINSRRELAHLFSRYWEDMLESLKVNNLQHWVTVSLRDKELAEQVGRLCKSLPETQSVSDAQTAEVLMNIVLLLDQIGPIRIRELSMHVEGIETMVAELYTQQAKVELQFLATFVETNTINYWINLQTKRRPDFHLTEKLNDLTHRLDRLRNCIRNTGYGFGLERMLYDLNPSMPCLSPLLENRYVRTLPQLMKQLDRMASKLEGDNIVDQHIAAFIASKLQIQHEIRLQQLSGIPALATNRIMISLHLLSMVQERIEPVRVPGLTHWFTIRLLPLLDSVHSRTLRQKIKGLLINTAPLGLLQKISQLLISADYAVADTKGFEKAIASYRQNAAEINSLKQTERLERETARMGLNLANIVALSGLLFSILYLVRELSQ